MVDDRRDRAPLGGLVGRALSRVYAVELSRRNRRFDRGAGVERGPVPVVSVGNLSVGGTGKTPTVAWVVERLAERGVRAGVAMRGYGAREGEPSDEQAEYAERLPGVAVEADKRRIEAVRRLAARGCDVAVLDDGFQHRWLGREFDLVVIDATRSPFRDRCLPAGWLREGVGSLARADAVLLTRCDQAQAGEVEAIEAAVRGVMGDGALVARSAHRWRGLVFGDGRRVDVGGEGWPERAVVACGIGHPGAFVGSAEAAGIDAVKRIVRRDHHRWTADEGRELARLGREVGCVVTTGKDWVKLREVIGPDEAEVFARTELCLDVYAGGETVASAIAGALGVGSSPGPSGRLGG